jgi:hypothetical protein
MSKKFNQEIENKNRDKIVLERLEKLFISVVLLCHFIRDEKNREKSIFTHTWVYTHTELNLQQI